MKLLPAILLSGLACGNAFGWGCEGHQIVAHIAALHLTPEARAAVYHLLKDNPIDPALSRFCKPVAADPMEDTATWADDIKRSAKNDVWHYIDIPRDVDHGDFTKYCPPTGDAKDLPGCIVSALDVELKILKDRDRSSADRASSLRYVIHLIGDLHTPLHTNDDVGGNCISVSLFDDPKPGNLHGAWDYGIIEHYLGQNNLTTDQLADQIDRQFHGDARDWLHGRIDIPEWIWESHQVSAQATYGKLNEKVPMENAVAGESCTAEREKTSALHIHVDEKYAAEVMPVIDRQLAKAGYRLADILNSAL